MKKIAIILSVSAFFIFSLNHVTKADEISNLKEQLKAMQAEMREQARKMTEMQQKIEKLETGQAASGRKPVVAEKPAKPEKPAGEGIRVYWRDGLRFETADKEFTLKAGGRIQADFGAMAQDSEVKGRLGKIDKPAEFRRLRVYGSGSVFENGVYKAQVDFADGEVAFRDVYIGLKGIPYIDLLRVGQFTEPFSLEDMTSSNHITFLERSLPYALSIHRQTGLGFNSAHFNKRVTFSASSFFNADDLARPESNALNFATRLTGLPFYENEGEKLLHLGVAYCFRNPPDKENFRYNSPPEIHLAPNFVDTGDFDAKFANLLGLESVLIYGPFSLQSEFIQSFVDLKGTSQTGYFNGFYASASYFLTGEHRNYDKFWAAFSGVKPHKNFSLKDWSLGALELAARYSYLDLSSHDVNGRALSDITVGCNWYLNPAMKVMFNYVHAHPNGVGDADIVAVRCQFYY
ncbi:MAG: porin [Candidatus Omnitrophota bacterium]